MKGISVFRDYFQDFQDQYVLIGGAACDLIFEAQDTAFRATKDLDIVLLVEASSKPADMNTEQKAAAPRSFTALTVRPSRNFPICWSCFPERAIFLRMNR